MLTEADSHLGLANRLLAGRARRVCLAFPIRAARASATWSPAGRSRARCWRPTAAPPGAASGSRPSPLPARSSAAARAPARSTSPPSTPSPSATGRDVHVAPPRRPPRLRGAAAAAGERAAPERYTLLEYEPNLGDVLAAADLVLGRAGGSIIEIAAAGRPAILVPYPHATADHQTPTPPGWARAARRW